MSTEPTEIGQPAAETQYGMLDRLAGLFYEPGRVFRSLRGRPDYVLPVILVLLTGILTLIAAMKLDYAAILPPDQAEQVAKVPPLFLAITSTLSVLAVTAVGWLLRTAVFIGLGKAIGGEGKFGPLLSVQGYVMVPQFLGVLLEAIAAVYTGRQIPMALSAILPLAKQGTTLGVLMGQVSPFVLGYLILSPLAVAEIMNIPRRKAWWIVLGAWAVAVLLQVGAAAVRTMLQPA